MGKKPPKEILSNLVLFSNKDLNSSFLHNEIKEVKYDVSVQGFNSFPKYYEYKIKVHGMIRSSLDDKIYDVDFFKKYFDFKKILFINKFGSKRDCDWWTLDLETKKEELFYSSILISNESEFNDVLKITNKTGILNQSLEISKYLDTISDIQTIEGDLYIDSPSFKSLGSVKFINGNLYIDNFKNRPPIDLNRLREVKRNIRLSGDIISFGNLETIHGNLDLRHCDFEGYDNIKLIKGDLFIKMSYKNCFNIPQVDGSVFHIRENNLINLIEERRNAEDEFRNYYPPVPSDKFEQIRVFIKDSDYINAYKLYSSLEFPYNQIREQGIVDLLFFHHFTNKIEINSNFIIRLCGYSKVLFTEIGKEFINEIIPFLEEEINKIDVFDFSNFNYKWISQYFNNSSIFIFKPGQINDPLPKGQFERDKIEKEEMYSQIEIMFKDVIKNAENKYRDSVGIKRVGEYWINETKLFYDLKDYFVDIDIIQHAQPSWIGNQHLDVFFPQYNIAVEYQGEQHFKPISVFGGEDGFKKTKERDERKKDLCKINNCALFFVKKGYDFKELSRKISIKMGIEIDNTDAQLELF